MTYKPPKPPPLSLGVQDDAQLRAGNMAPLQHGRALGAKAVRVIVPIKDVSTPSGRFDFSKYDQIVKSARMRGIRPQLVLDSNAHGGNSTNYVRFASEAAKHFKGKVHRYSLVNEPDLRMTPEKYRELYIRGRRAVKKADNSAGILFGELSARDPVGYSKRVLKKGGVRAEGFALHPYQFTQDPLTPGDNDPSTPGDSRGVIGRLGHVTSEVGRLNLRTPMGRRPGMFLTEFGYRNAAPSNVSPQQAAAWWPRAIRKAQGAGARQIIAYQMSSDPNPAASWDTGLLDAQGNPRPAYAAIARAFGRSGRR